MKRIATFLRCKLGKHNWVQTVKCVTLDGCKRECLECGKVQVPNYDMSYGRTYWTDKI